MAITLHESQSEVFKDLFVDKVCRNAVVVASRGFGKSFLAGAAGLTGVFELLELDYSVPNKNVYIIAPTYSQVTDIYYPLLAYQMGAEQYTISSSRDTGIFKYPKDVTLKLVSYEAVERLRGTGSYLTVNDEVSSWTKGVGFKEAWQGIIEPCITTRWSPRRARLFGAKSPGRSLTISTPKGYNFLYDMYNYAEIDSTWKSYHFDYTRSPLLDPDEIERVKHRIDPLEFAREYLASFQESGNNVFYCFDRKVHVSNEVALPVPGEDIHCAIDFNVGVQATSIWVVRGQQKHCVDEFKGHPDTESLGAAIKRKYGERHKIYAYPDPTGKSRKTSAPIGRTDFTILQSFGLRVLARDGSPPIVDSVAAVNRQLKTAAGENFIYVRPECSGVITSLERTVWKENNPDTATIDKDDGVEHFSDGIRYFFEYRWPVRHNGPRAKVGSKF